MTEFRERFIAWELYLRWEKIPWNERSISKTQRKIKRKDGKVKYTKVTNGGPKRIKAQEQEKMETVSGGINLNKLK